jgi:hypothetical protein
MQELWDNTYLAGAGNAGRLYLPRPLACQRGTARKKRGRVAIAIEI